MLRAVGRLWTVTWAYKTQRALLHVVCCNLDSRCACCLSLARLVCQKTETAVAYTAAAAVPAAEVRLVLLIL